MEEEQRLLAAERARAEAAAAEEARQLAIRREQAAAREVRTGVCVLVFHLGAWAWERGAYLGYLRQIRYD